MYVSKDAVDAAENGTASEATYQRVEALLDRIQAAERYLAPHDLALRVMVLESQVKALIAAMHLPSEWLDKAMEQIEERSKRPAQPPEGD